VNDKIIKGQMQQLFDELKESQSRQV